MTLMRLLVASSLAFEQGSSSAIDNHLIFVFQKGLKSSLKDGMYTAKRLLNEIHNVLEVPASKKVAFLESPCWSSVYEKSGDKIVYR